jgi:L-asparagine oxygenase
MDRLWQPSLLAMAPGTPGASRGWCEASANKWPWPSSNVDLDIGHGVDLALEAPTLEPGVKMLRIDIPDDVASRLRYYLAGPAPALSEIEPLLAHLLQASSIIPSEMLQNVLTYRADPHGPAALLITGLPLDLDLPPTPDEPSHPPYKPDAISERALLLVALLLGEPVAYLAEKDGQLVQDVFPVRSQRDRPSNESWGAPLGFHTELVFSPAAPEQPFHVAAPDFVLLLALRCAQDRSAATLFVEAKDVCERLSLRHLACLREPNFRLLAPYSFTRAGDGSRPLSAPVPILRGPTDAPSLAFDSACGIQALSEEAEEAFLALVQGCETPALQRQVRLGPGDLLALNNNRCMHARSAFQARFDGQDRWLQRAYVRRSIWPLQAASAGSFRVLA